MNMLHLRADSYLDPSEAFHVARVTLQPVRPDASHDHDFFEVFLVESGAANHHVNGQDESLAEGDLVFVRPADCHALWSPRGQNCCILNLMFRADTVDRLFKQYGPDLGQRFFWSAGACPEKIHLDQEQHFSISAALNVLFSAQRSQLALDGFLIRLLAEHAVTHRLSSKLPLWLSEGLKRADAPEYLHQGATGLARACGRSPEHVSRTVKRHLGRSSSEVMNAKRMTHAARLLLSTNQTIEEIALACGFENQSYFFRLFRQRHGMTPRQYRVTKFRDPVNPV